jgi:hypothetical protein
MYSYSYKSSDIEVCTVWLLRNQIFRGFGSYAWLISSRRLEELLPVYTPTHNPKDEVSMFIRNIERKLPKHTARNPEDFPSQYRNRLETNKNFQRCVISSRQCGQIPARPSRIFIVVCPVSLSVSLSFFHLLVTKATRCMAVLFAAL